MDASPPRILRSPPKLDRQEADISSLPSVLEQQTTDVSVLGRNVCDSFVERERGHDAHLSTLVDR